MDMMQLLELLKKQSQQSPPLTPQANPYGMAPQSFNFAESPFPATAPQPQGNGLPPRNRSDLAPAPAPAPQGPDLMGPHELVGPTRDLAGPMGIGEFEQPGPPVSAEQLVEIETPDREKKDLTIDQPFYKDSNRMAMMLSQLSNGLSGMTLRGKSGMAKMNNATFANAMGNIKENQTMNYLAKNDPKMAEKLMSVPPQYRGEFMKQYISSMGGSGLTDAVKSKMQLAQILGMDPDSDKFESFLTGGKSNWEEASALRQEFNKDGGTKYFADMTNSFNRMVKSVGTDAASDMALIFNYMKMLDPGSTVREGEYATARNTTGAAGQIANLYNYLKDGNQLNASQREAFFNKGKAIYEGALSDYNQLRTQYEDLAASQGLSDIYLDHRRDLNLDDVSFGVEEEVAVQNSQQLSADQQAELQSILSLTPAARSQRLLDLRESNPELWRVLSGEINRNHGL